MAYKFQRGQARLSGSIIAENGLTSETTVSGSGNLDVGGEITGSAILLIDASGIAGTALEDDTTGKLKISDGVDKFFIY